MKILEVTFDCTIPMPGYANVKPGIGRATLDEGETPEQAWTELNRRAKEWHKKEYPHLYQEQDISQNGNETLKPHLPSVMSGIPSVAVIDYGKHDASPDGVLNDIKRSETLEELKSYKLLASTDKELHKAYMKRVAELSKPTNFTDGLE